MKLARAKWTNGQEGSSLVLQALADVIVAADASKALAQHASELRFEAERLRDASRPTLGQPASVKRGLNIALDCLDRIQGRDDDQSSNWTRVARQSVATIEERSSIGLQRGPIQDAFRATVDAFAAELVPAVPR